MTLVYPGDIDSGKSLLRHLRRCARNALIDGIPYKQFWGEALPLRNVASFRRRGTSFCVRKMRRKSSGCSSG